MSDIRILFNDGTALSVIGVPTFDPVEGFLIVNQGEESYMTFNWDSICFFESTPEDDDDDD